MKLNKALWCKWYRPQVSWLGGVGSEGLKDPPIHQKGPLLHRIANA